MENKTENNEHVKKVYADKASNLLRVCMGISAFSFCTYMIDSFLFNAFDFGCIFEGISFIFVLLAYYQIPKYSWQTSKRNVIIAMLPLGWLLIYDLIQLLTHPEILFYPFEYYVSLNEYFYYFGPYLFDITLIASLLLLYRTFLSLSIADGTRKNNSPVDTFYDTP